MFSVYHRGRTYGLGNWSTEPTFRAAVQAAKDGSRQGYNLGVADSTGQVLGYAENGRWIPNPEHGSAVEE